jgi:hypothetical protein
MEPEPGVTAVEKYFFSPIYYPRSAWSVIGWWESRRPLYNVCVGAAGLASLGVAITLFGWPPRGFPWGGILAYGTAANLCYSLGAPLDLMLRRLLGDRAPAVSQAVFRYGFAFSLGLTLLPIPVAVFGWVMHLIFG